MKFEFTKHEGYGLFSLSGRLIGEHEGAEIVDILTRELEENTHNFVMDLSDLEYVNSSGLNVLIGMMTRARKADGHLYLAAISPSLKQLFIITKLNKLFNITSSVQEAIDMINSGSMGKKNNKVDVLLGLQWGDEGKGKIVDYLAPRYDIIARFQGGPNAGHTLVIGDQKCVLHTIPSGIFHDTINLIGNGVVIDPITFTNEVERVTELGVDLRSKLVIDKKANLILPTHKILDAASEASKGNLKIGSTLKGIGPAYMDKTGRNSLRVGDIFTDRFEEKYNALKEKHEKLIALYDYEYALGEMEADWMQGIELIKEFETVNSTYFLEEKMAAGMKVLAEGAQGSMLDIDFGTYPYVTSSNTITAGVCTGLGIAPSQIGKVIGITKAYCTRVGSGPFPTELEDETGERLRKEGAEFGATTGRPRRCGWIDLPALKYAIRLSGVTDLVITKIDVLNVFDKVVACDAYHIDGELTGELPYDMEAVDLKPNWVEFPGWASDISGIDSRSDLPEALRSYLNYLEKELETPVVIISTGPERTELIDSGVSEQIPI